MKNYLKIASCFLCLFTAYSVLAHHSLANFIFDESKRITIEGKVTYWSFTNPHSFIDVDVTDESGKIISSKVFLTSRVALQRFGWRPESLKPGDTIVIAGSPDIKNPAELFLQNVVLPDGKTWSHDDLNL